MLLKDEGDNFTKQQKRDNHTKYDMVPGDAGSQGYLTKVGNSQRSGKHNIVFDSGRKKQV